MKNRLNFRVNVLLLLVASVLAFAAYSIGGANQAQAQGIPAAPYLFAGSVTVSGSVVPDGLPVSARIGEYESEPSLTENGRYPLLTVSPDLEDSRDLQNLPIHFYLDGVKANESKTYKVAGLPVIDLSFNLTFPNLPVPTPTPTPVPVLPAVYSGAVAVIGGIVPTDAVLIGQIGGYRSPPAVIQHGVYMNLVIDPNDPALRGEKIEFLLNGVIAARTDSYVSGIFVRDFDLVFNQLPTPTPIATATPVPATVTPLPSPSPTKVPPTATAIPPTATATPVPATPTVLPTATMSSTPLPTSSSATVAPTSTFTPQPAKATAKPTIPAVVSAVIVPESGDNGEGASSTGGDCALAPGGSSGGSGTENVLLLMAPLALVLGIRRRQKKNSK